MDAAARVRYIGMNYTIKFFYLQEENERIFHILIVFHNFTPEF